MVSVRVLVSVPPEFSAEIWRCHVPAAPVVPVMRPVVGLRLSHGGRPWAPNAVGLREAVI